jgi:hypothetical protein
MSRTPCNIAHDFANVVTVIRGHAELVNGRLESYHPARADLAMLIKAAEEAAVLTFELRSLVCDEQALPPR